MKPTLSNLRALFSFAFNARINYEMSCNGVAHTIAMIASTPKHIGYIFVLRTKIALVFSSGLLDLTVYLSKTVGGASDRSIGCT